MELDSRSGLGTEPTPHGKGSELASMVALVEALDLKGAVVTVNAIGCDDKMANAIVARGGHYAMQVKANQKLSESWIQDGFNKNQDEPRHVQEPSQVLRLVRPTQVGRTRRLGVRGRGQRMHAEKDVSKSGQVDAVEKRYDVSSISGPAHLAKSIRAHWSVENSLH